MEHTENFEKLLNTIKEERDRLTALVIHLNDTYLIEERKDRGLPGLPRIIATVRYLREYVEQITGRDRVIVVHSGDFLGPSLLAKKDKGKAMVDLLERVGLDFCVLGNHEFDHEAEELKERIRGRRFKVLSANIKDPTNLVKVHSGAYWPSDAEPLVALRERLAAYHENAEGPFESLAEALTRIHYKPDLRAWKLYFDDHQTASGDDTRMVNEALAQIASPEDTCLVKDLSSITDQLEARDSHLRRQPTNFGSFVAECVRIHGKADIAIVHAGTFRCDSLLKPEVYVRDLRETFLYDKDDAVITMELETTVIDALIEHGKSRNGGGGYPQISDRRPNLTEAQGSDHSTFASASLIAWLQRLLRAFSSFFMHSASSKVVLAISSYLLLDEKSIDGYDLIFARCLGIPDVARARQVALQAKIGGFRIVDALKREAMNVTFNESATESSSEVEPGTLIELLKKYADAFYREIESEKAKGHSGTQGERDTLFREWLGGDAPIPFDGIHKARNAVRSFLRKLPAVANYQNNSSLGASGQRDAWIDLWSAAEKELVAMQSKVAGHDFVFRDRANYKWLFDLAARGLPGWPSLSRRH